MKRVSLLVIVGVLIVGTVWARNIRVKFPPGRTTVVLKGRTTGGPSESGGMDPIDLGENAKDWTGVLPKTGDYQISVWPDDEKTNTTFTLEITVR